jgi:hypothetical protein
VNENQSKTNESVFTEAGRSLGRSRRGRFFVSLAVAILFSCLAYAAWHARDLAATVLTVGLLIYGFQLAWRILPISSATRARWVRDEQIAERAPAGQYRGLLWAGIGVAIMDFWQSDAAKPFNYFDLIMPGILIIAGTISYILCHRFIRNERRA